MSPQSLLDSGLSNLKSVSPSQGGEVTFCFPVYSSIVFIALACGRAPLRH